MNKSVFEFSDYKAYLEAFIVGQPKRGHGIRTQLSEAVGCQLAYLSQILKGKADFTLEQAGKANRFLGHSKEESHFFMLLVQRSRAADLPTRNYFSEQLEELLQLRKQIKNRIGMAQNLTLEDQLTYYGSWHYVALHILLTIPAYQTKQAMTEKLGISIEKLNELLEFLLRTGLAEQHGNRFVTGSAHIHLGNDSKLVAKHHANWRLKAMQSLDTEKKNDLHYSSAVSLSVKDAAAIRALLLKSISEAVEIVKVSPEEKLCGVCVDFFEL